MKIKVQYERTYVFERELELDTQNFQKTSINLLRNNTTIFKNTNEDIFIRLTALEHDSLKDRKQIIKLITVEHE